MRQNRIESTSSRRLLTAGSPASTAPLFTERPLSLAVPLSSASATSPFLASGPLQGLRPPKAGSDPESRGACAYATAAGTSKTQPPSRRLPNQTTLLGRQRRPGLSFLAKLKTGAGGSPPAGSPAKGGPTCILSFSFYPHCPLPANTKYKLPCSRVSHCSGQPDHIKTSRG